MNMETQQENPNPDQDLILSETAPLPPPSVEEEIAAEPAPAEEEIAAAPPEIEIASADLQSSIEAILFSSERSVSVARLKEVFGEEGPSQDAIQLALEALIERYRAPEFGIELRGSQGGFHFVTKVANAELIRKYHASKPFRLGRSALETLAIIAYRQPITRAEIDQVRGIDSSHLMRTLIERGLVKMAGKADIPGRPVQYGTTEKFLEIVGLKDLSELPPLSELEQLQGSVDDPAKRVEEGLERFIANDIRPATALEQTDEQLDEIGSLINSAGDGARELFASPVHAEVAAENKAALEGFLATFKQRRKTKVSTAPVGEQEPGVIPEPQPVSEEEVVISAEHAALDEVVPTENVGITYEDLVPGSGVTN